MVSGIATAGAQTKKIFAALAKSAISDLRETFAPVLEGIGTLAREVILPAFQSVGRIVGGVVLTAFAGFASFLRVTVGPVMEGIGFVLGTVIPKAAEAVGKAFGAVRDFVVGMVGTMITAVGSLLEKLAFLPIVGDEIEQAAQKFQTFGMELAEITTPAVTSCTP